MITGHGFGPGVGLSQWGAEERASAGQTAGRILSFYYPGARLGTMPTAAATVRVLVAEEGGVRIGSSSAFTVRDAGGGEARLAGGAYTRRRHGAPALGGLALPLTVEPGSAPLEVDGTGYPGPLTLRRERTRLQAIVTLPLERYLVGVVSSECYGGWPEQALSAQAIASRTYALAYLNPAAPFDLYNDDRSQNYHGLAREFPAAAAAVAATAGDVMLYGGRPIEAFFTASNGGMTRTADEAWGGASLPYIVSRPDPYDARSPARDWGPVVVSIDRLRSAFPEIPSRIVGAGVTLTRANRAAAVTLEARRRLALRDPRADAAGTAPSPLHLLHRRRHIRGVSLSARRSLDRPVPLAKAAGLCKVRGEATHRATAGWGVCPPADRGEIHMSGHVGSQVRALPFTGFTALPFIIVGIVLSAVGAVMRKVSRPETDGLSTSAGPGPAGPDESSLRCVLRPVGPKRDDCVRRRLGGASEDDDAAAGRHSRRVGERLRQAAGES